MCKRLFDWGGGGEDFYTKKTVEVVGLAVFIRKK